LIGINFLSLGTSVSLSDRNYLSNVYMKIPDISTVKKMTLAGKERVIQEESERLASEIDAKRYQKKLERTWDLQIRKLVKSAIDQKNSVSSTSIIFPKRLIDEDFEIVEIGDITDHYFKDRSRADFIERLDKLIPTFSAHAPESALRIWDYWEDIDKDLKLEIENFLNRAKSSKFEEGEFLRHLGGIGKFKRLQLARFEAVLQNIQDSIRTVKEIMLISNWTSFKFKDVDQLLKKTLDGRYFFSKAYGFNDELQVAVMGNKFEISWADGVSSYFNPPKNLISADGLTWLMQDDGQRLCVEVGKRISQRANEGFSSFILFLDANLLSDEDGFMATSPSGDFLVELISFLGYKIKRNKVLGKVVEFEVSW
jgi:hypothetical protein